MISETVRCRKNAIVPKHPDHRTGPIVQWSPGLLSAAVTQSAAEEPDHDRADGRNQPQKNAATPREAPWRWLLIGHFLLRHARRCYGHVRILALSRADAWQDELGHLYSRRMASQRPGILFRVKILNRSRRGPELRAEE